MKHPTFRKAAALFLCLCLGAVLALPLAAHAAAGDIRIEQVAIDLPTAHAYFYIEGDDAQSADITATLGGDALTVDEVHRYDDAQDATHYIFMVDCSTSISAAQIDGVKAALAAFAGNMAASDSMTLFSFGVDVKQLLLRSKDQAEIDAAVQGLAAEEAGTVFFDALARAIDLDATRAFALERKVCFVFSDSVDYNLGGYTKDELDQMLAASALPIYALGFDTGDKTALDNFGALARTSGGVIHIVSESTVSDALQQMAAETKNVFVAELHAASNVIKGSPLPFVLTDQASGVQQQKQVPVRFYVPDNEAPQVLRAEQLTDESIRIYFNIPVQGAGSGESYTVQAESGDLLGIRAAAYDGSGRFATLTFTDKPATGMLTIRFPGITDISMEKNGIETALTLDFRAQVLPPEDEGIPIYLWFIIPIVCITLIAIVAIVATRRRAAGKAAMAESETPYARPAAEDGTAVVRLHITNLQGESRSVVLPAGKPIFVGRRAANDLVIDDSSLADQQFVIDHTHGTGYVLTNLSKTDETLVNDAPISTSHVLKDGDIIVAGRQVIVFHTKP